LPEATRRTAWTKFVMSVIKNRSVWENQHLDGRCSDELLEDITSLATMDAYLDPMMAPYANISRGLQKVILLLQTVNYCTDNGTMRLMTFTRAMVAEKRRGEVLSIVDNTPSAADFLRNRNTSNHVQRNCLDVPTAAAAAAWTSSAALPTDVLPLSLW
jgi:hypothetical protein